jgi:hypothetical protein
LTLIARQSPTHAEPRLAADRSATPSTEIGLNRVGHGPFEITGLISRVTDVQTTTVASGFKFLEGPRWHEDGA